MLDIARQDSGQADDARSRPDGRTRGTGPPARGGGLQHGRRPAATPHRRAGRQRRRGLEDRHVPPTLRCAPLSVAHLAAARPQARPGAATVADSNASPTAVHSSINVQRAAFPEFRRIAWVICSPTRDDGRTDPPTPSAFVLVLRARQRGWSWRPGARRPRAAGHEVLT